jgi:hypothetical protein
VQAKQRIVLLVVLLFGLPAIVTTALLFTNVPRAVHDGPQPGGVVRGIVHDEQQQPIAGVEVSALALLSDGTPTQLGTTHAGAHGEFELSLPPVQGRYWLQFKGPEWQLAAVEHGWLDQAGRPFDPGKLDVTLHEGCSLEVDLVRAENKPAGPGTFELEGAPSTGLFGSWLGARETRHGSFANGSFSVESLPPMHARLMIRMSTGERIDSTLDLVRGKNHHKVEL